MAIDPGYDRMGLAVLERVNGKDTLLYSGCFITVRGDSLPDRLVALGSELKRIIKEYHPSLLATETLFFTKNQKTAMSVAEARGTVLYLAREAGLSVHEFTPLAVKIAVTGYGRSDKGQVTAMTKRLITISKEIKYDDEYDAIAIGITCLASLAHMKRLASA